jgi:hypothetical protein
LAAGVYVTLAVQLEPNPLGVQLGAPTVPNVPCKGAVPSANVTDALSMSVPVNVISNAVSSAGVALCALATGASFTAVIVRLTVATLESELPSLALNVKLSAPL